MRDEIQDDQGDAEVPCGRPEGVEGKLRLDEAGARAARPHLPLERGGLPQAGLATGVALEDGCDLEVEGGGEVPKAW